MTDFYKKYCVQCPQNKGNICPWGEEKSPTKETVNCIYPKMYPKHFNKSKKQIIKSFQKILDN